MKGWTTFFCVAFATGAITLLAAGPAQARARLKAADCIAPGQISEWHVVNNRTVTLRTGPKYYLMHLQNACPSLQHPPGLIFHASQSNLAANGGRICGDFGETVHSQGQPACAVASMQRISEARYDKLNKPALQPAPTHRSPMK